MNIVKDLSKIIDDCTDNEIDFKDLYYELIYLRDKYSKQLTLNDVGFNLPSKNERVKYCNDLANKHGVTEVFKRETLIKGFHLGYRYAKSFIK